LHPKHVEQGKCNKVTLNNLHQAGLNKPIQCNTLTVRFIQNKQTHHVGKSGFSKF